MSKTKYTSVLVFSGLKSAVLILSFCFFFFTLPSLENGKKVLLSDLIWSFKLDVLYGLVFASFFWPVFTVVSGEHIPDPLGIGVLKKRTPFWGRLILGQIVLFVFIVFSFLVSIHPDWKDLDTLIYIHWKSMVELLIFYFFVSPFWSWFFLTVENKKQSLFTSDLHIVYKNSLVLSRMGVADVCKGCFRAILILMVSAAFVPSVFFVVFRRLSLLTWSFINLGFFIFFGMLTVSVASQILARKRILRDYENFESFEMFEMYDKETDFSKKFVF